MLVLGRRVNEYIMIGDDIKIKIVELKNNQVKIGIDAPEDITVHRSEIYNKIQNEKKQEVSTMASKIIKALTGLKDLPES